MWYILRRHINNLFIRARKQPDRQVATTRDQLVMTLYDVDRLPTTLDVVVLPDDPSLQFVIVKNIYSGQCNVQTGVINGGGITPFRYCISNADGRKHGNAIMSMQQGNRFNLRTLW